MLKPLLLIPLKTLCVASHNCFKWNKQHLHIKTFYGTSQNAVYTQIWIAVCDYLLLIITEEIWSCSKSSFHLELNRTGGLQKI